MFRCEKQVEKCDLKWSAVNLPKGEPTVPILEHLFESLIRTSDRLQELGFTYYNGKIVVIEEEEEKHV